MITKENYKLSWLIVAVGLLGGACEYAADVSDDLTDQPYFDMPSLVKQQLVRLDSLNPSVELVAQVGDREEVETIKKDSAEWEETLKLFSDANINRPVLQGSYSVVDSIDQQHQWKIRVYQAKEPQEVEVPYLIVYYQDSLADVRRIETKFWEENLLYSTTRYLAMQFESSSSGPQLVSYRSQGHQKMILRDSVYYDLEAILSYL